LRGDALLMELLHAAVTLADDQATWPSPMTTGDADA
jgi:hypothetical protein